MKFYAVLLLAILTTPAFGQGDYKSYVDDFKSKLTDTQLPLWYLYKGIKSLTFYSCDDTIFNEKRCHKTRFVSFDSKSNLVLDTVYSGKQTLGRKIEIQREYIKVIEPSYDNNRSFFAIPEIIIKVDSFRINKMKDPVELYVNKKLKTKWGYDSIGRIITKMEDPNDSSHFETIHIDYRPNSINKTTETKFYDKISFKKVELFFDAKSKLILRENIYNGEIKFYHHGRVIYKDSVILNQPLELSRYVVYSYLPANTRMVAFYDKELTMTVTSKHDSKKRITSQYVLNEKGDTLSYDHYEYAKRKVIQNSYQGNKFFDRTTKYLNNKGRLIKKHEVAAEPRIWKITEYSNGGIMTRQVDVNFDYITTEIIIIEK
ncbi:MAG TPA: hypothetical protein VFU05_16920 [Cyclobacteriaceae bacterium]|nr:hypothetical protein [Cyclobacteriaceae bacterium]